MARTDNTFTEKDGSYIKTIWAAGRNWLINGANKYLNFNTISGETGYGIRDNDGTLQAKNSGGSWANLGVGGGQTNTASNLGLGEGVFKQKTGVDLEFKTLVGGSGITLSEDGEEITIDADGGGTTVDHVSNVATDTILGRITASSGDSEELTPAQVRTLINVADGATPDQDISGKQNILAEGAFVNGDKTKLDTYSEANQTSNNAKVTYPSADATKVGHITVTQAVNLDTMESDIAALEQAVVLKGLWDASAGTFPGAGIAQAGFSYIVSVGGTVNGVVFTANDRLVAILDNASTTTYASNWHKLDYTDEVLSVAGRTGAVVLVKADVGLGNVDNTADTDKPVSTAQETALNLKANDSVVVKLTGSQTIDGVKTFSSDVLVPDEVYDATDWNGSLEVPTKNAVRDKIESMSIGGGGGESASVSITQASHGLSVGDVLKKVGASYALAQADSAANAEVVGIISVVTDVNTFTLLTSGYLSTLTGLTANETYFLSPTVAGGVTVTNPTTVGQVSKPLFNSVSTTAAVFNNMRGNVISAGGAGPSAGGADRQLQFNDAGAFAGADNVEIGDAGNLRLVSINAKPTAPPVDRIQLYARKRAGTDWLDFQRSSGRDIPLQSHFGVNRIATWSPNTSTNVIISGMPRTVVGSVSHPALASTNLSTSARRWRVTSAALANSVADDRSPSTLCFRGNAAGRGGWLYTNRISLTAVSSLSRWFFGILASTAALSTTQDPKALTNVVGFGFTQGTDTNWQVYHNDGSGVVTEIDMGPDFPVASTTNLYTFFIDAQPNSDSIWVRAVEEVSGAVFEQEITTNIPANTTFLSVRNYANNGGTASAVQYDCSGVYLETDY